MKPTVCLRAATPGIMRLIRLALAGASAVLTTLHFGAQCAEFNQTEHTPGGVTSHPMITSIRPVPGKESVLIKWIGVQGPYQLQRKSSLADATWTDVGAAGDSLEITVPKADASAFHRVSGGAPDYLGAETCAECHSDIYDSWSQTAHGNAYQTLKNIHQQENPACVVCHTVGAGVSSGFRSEAGTPQFVNVQCENCHGPGGSHVASGEPPTIYPITTTSPLMCGGCHNDFHHPTYEEWKGSPHSEVIEELAGEFSNADRTAAIARMSTCGPCHSGAVRLAMLKANNLSQWKDRTNVIWPSAVATTNTAQVCIVCHDQHGIHVYKNVVDGAMYTNQLRNPLTSFVNFSYNTGTNFASQYNPEVNVCGQCHNARGATLTSSSRPPHYSPQYNIFLGNIGVTTEAPPPQGQHRNNPKQCAGCHTHRHGEGNPTPTTPVYTGHAFRPSIEACMECHKEPTGVNSATNRLFTTQSMVQGMISDTKNLLDLWATTKNPNAWASKYEARGWEYTSPGELSNPSGSTSIVGPTAAEQAQIPDAIKQARFNLYLVNRDKSRGVHNPPYIKHLLNVAQQKVSAELAR